MTMCFVTGRNSKVQIFGPEGIREVVDGFTKAYELDRGYRVAHHRPLFNELSHGFDVSTIRNPIDEGGRTGLTIRDAVPKAMSIYGFSVDHGPVSPSFGYRLEYNKAVVVVSGDTKHCPSLLKNCFGAQLVVQEALCCDVMQMVSDVNKAAGNAIVSKLSRDVINYHTSVQDCVDIARTCNIPLMLLTHLVPSPQNRVLFSAYLKNVSRPPGYMGRVVFGEDGTLAAIDPESGEVKILQNDKQKTMNCIWLTFCAIFTAGLGLYLYQIVYEESFANENVQLMAIQTAGALVLLGSLGAVSTNRYHQWEL
jgi:ribonuclease Z